LFARVRRAFFDGRKQSRSDAPLPDALLALRRQAEAGHTAAQVAWGQALLDGKAGEPDARRARAWFAIAAGAGDPLGLTMYGRALERGWGGPVDFVHAFTLYRQAAEMGENWARYNLANMLLRGRGCVRDRPAAWTFFLAAAVEGHAKSMTLVGRFLEEGWDRPRDRGAAMLWYQRGAEGGDYRGQHNLASLLAEDGRIEEARAWWRRVLPEATPDIVEAMEDALRQIPGEEAAALLRAVSARLP
jgi:TPR repeat protein